MSGRRVGYLNLRTFISTADPQLRAAFDNFRSQGVTQLIVDFRYNGGGLVSIADLMGDLMGAGRTNSVFSYTTYRPEKANNNSTAFFTPAAAIDRADEDRLHRHWWDRFGERTGDQQLHPLPARQQRAGRREHLRQAGRADRARPRPCDDRLRVVAFKTENAERQGDYYTGLASEVEASCRAADDIQRPLGDPAEASVKGALDFLAGRTCTPIGATAGQAAQAVRGRTLLQGERPSTAERDVPGLH